MRKHMMPKAQQIEQPTGLQWEIKPQALERWTPDLMAAATATTDNTISVLDTIGVDPWTGEGVTAKRIAGALRAIGADKDVIVNINSPGGDLFEGMAIYNLLRDHKGGVTVKILGLAASAASIIAMAGDSILIARAGFLMVHNTWVVAMGNRLDLRAIADTLQPFDSVMADIYAARSGLEAKATQKMMDNETWIGGSDAVAQGFADELLPADQVAKDANAKADRIAAHLIDVAMAKAGLSRSDRHGLINDFRSATQKAGAVGTQIAANNSTQIAADAVEVEETLSVLRNFSNSIIKETP